ncbi:MAG TPA: hypothetical protein VIV60_03805, partial [Polyangiaceae bacterium]
MNHPMEPPRLLVDDDADPLVRQLLQSGLHEGPSKNAMLAAPAAIAAIMATHSVTTAAATAATATAAAATSAKVAAAAAPMSSTTIAALPILAKSIGIGLVLGGTMVATAVKVTDPTNHVPASSVAASPKRSREPARVSVPSPEQSPPSSAQALEASVSENSLSPGESPVVTAPPGLRTRALPTHLSVQPRATDSSNGHPGIAREIELIDAARRALVGGDADHAIAQLDRHAELGRRSLEPEATVLRV